MGIVVIGAVFVDVKGYPEGAYIPGGRNKGWIEQTHGGVGRNVVEDIANVELRPTLVTLVDQTGMGQDVIDKLKKHKVNTNYIRATPNGMGTWLAVFDSTGDVTASISQRPDLTPIEDILDQQGDEIIKNADSVIVEIDMGHEIVKKAFKLAKKYNKKIFSVVANMSIALERRDLLKEIDCFVCNRQEAEIMFLEDYSGKSVDEMVEIIGQRVQNSQMKAMIVTMGADGAVYAERNGNRGWCPARNVTVRDTTGAGDSFCAGVAIGMTYGKDIADACRIGSQLAASVITTAENVCPRFHPRELGLDMDIPD